MSNFISYLADLSDPTFLTREVDLNGFEISNGPFETDPDSFDLGAPDLDAIWLSEDGKDEDVLAAHRRGRVVASFDLRIGPVTGQSFANLQGHLRRLNAALDRSGVWVLQQPGQATPLYIDYYPSPLIQQLMPGERSLFYLWKQLQQPNGMRVQVVRRPKMRAAAQDAAVNLAHNGTLAEDHDDDGIPTYWQWSDDTGLSDYGFSWTFAAATVKFATGGALFFYQDSDADLVDVGSTYSFAMDVAATYSLKPTVRARIDWLDSDGDLIGSSVYGTAVAILLPPRSAYARPSISGAVAPTGAVTARYGVEIQPQSTAAVTMYLRNAQFQTGASPTDFRAGFETISQVPGDPFYKHLWLANAGNADALGQIRALPSIGAEVARMTYARRSGERDSAEAMRIFAGWAAADSSDLLSGTTSYSDGGVTVAKSALTDDVMTPMVRQNVGQSNESALRGTWRIRAALRGDVDDVYQFELRYGLGNVDDLPRTTELHPTLDMNGLAESDYYVVDLGLIQIPANSPGVYIELWAMRVTSDDGDGDGELFVDQFWPEPVDDDLYAIASVPGAQVPGPVTESRKGKKLSTPPDELADDPGTSDPFTEGSIYNDGLLLNAQWEAASLPSDMTATLTPDVQHTFIVDVVLYTAPQSGGSHDGEVLAKKHGEIRIHNLTDDSQVKFAGIKNTPGVKWDEKFITLRFIPTVGKAYLVYVVMSEDIDGSIRVERIDHSYVPPIEGGTETIAIDADQRRAYVLNETSQFVNDLDLVPPFPTLMPKLQLLRVSFAGLGPDGSDDVLDDGVGLVHDRDLTATFGVHMIPRWFN